MYPDILHAGKKVRLQKQLTIPLLPDPNCSMPDNDTQCVIPVKRTDYKKNLKELAE